MEKRENVVDEEIRAEGSSSARLWRGMCSGSTVRLTVWQKSLLFHGNGYTVYNDADGRMVFRVENYAQDWRQEAALMDFSGNVLLTIRRRRSKLPSMKEIWEAFHGDEDASKLTSKRQPFLKATKDSINNSCKVTIASDALEPNQAYSYSHSYMMTWSNHKKCSKIYRIADARIVAEMDRKHGKMERTIIDRDVFSLRVQPGMNQAIVMALVMITNSMR
ncbi:hypothetical protein HPP92_018256 [Vanilla planifolia]|uniref:Uncharacterized protein n=1 Tax=Vanilla planifolia TaxID=51239 RepID=A0A835UP81_VANPL|nr:hypothetical protein HPP92_018256 [Vanilla planifolia]